MLAPHVSSSSESRLTPHGDLAFVSHGSGCCCSGWSNCWTGVQKCMLRRQRKQSNGNVTPDFLRTPGSPGSSSGRFRTESDLKYASPFNGMGSPQLSNVSTRAGSPLGEALILHSDSAAYLNAKQRAPEALKSGSQKACFCGQMESLRAARKSSKVLINGSDELLTLQLMAKLQQMGMPGEWRIPFAARQTLESELGLNTHQLMQKLLVVAQHLATPVVSVFHVGAVGLGVSGDLFLGSNVEISSGMYASNVCGFHYCLHAEQAVVLNMFEGGETGLQSLYISAVPCGMCRQFLTELPDYKNIQIWTPQIDKVVPLIDLLPHAFGPIDLGMSRTLLSSSLPNAVELFEDSEAKLVDPILARDVVAAAQRAHAPYTSSFAGAVVRLVDGRQYCGSAVESVAFNPSVSPLQAALLALFVHGGKVEEIESACLAEDPSSPITYKGSDGMLLAAVAPWVSLWIIPLKTTIEDAK